MREDKFKPIRDIFLDYFKQEAAKINKDFDFISCDVGVFFPPNDSDHGSFTMYIDCILEQAEYEGSDNVSLDIQVWDQNNKLTITGGIGWGHPSGKSEQEFFENPADATQENIDFIKEKLPSMILKLRESFTKAKS